MPSESGAPFIRNFWQEHGDTLPFYLLTAVCVTMTVLCLAVFLVRGTELVEVTTKHLTEVATIKRDDKATSKPAPSVCKTSDCRKIASQLAQQLNDHQLPCDDFYNYVCSNFEGTTLLDDLTTKSEENLMSMVTYRQSNEARSVIQAASKVYKLCKAVPQEQSDDSDDVKAFMKSMKIDISHIYEANRSAFSLLARMMRLSLEHSIHVFCVFRRRPEYRMPGKDAVIEVTLNEDFLQYLHRDTYWESEAIFEKMFVRYTSLDRDGAYSLSQNLIATSSVAKRDLSDRGIHPGSEAEFHLMNIGEVAAHTEKHLFEGDWRDALDATQVTKGISSPGFLADVRALSLIHYIAGPYMLPMMSKMFESFVLLWRTIDSKDSYLWTPTLPRPPVHPNPYSSSDCEKNFRTFLGDGARAFMHLNGTTTQAMAVANSIELDIRETLLSRLETQSSGLQGNVSRHARAVLSSVQVTTGYPSGLTKLLDDRLRHLQFNFGVYSHAEAIEELEKSGLRDPQSPLVLQPMWFDPLAATNALYYGPQSMVYVPPLLLQPPVLYSNGSVPYNYGVFGNIFATTLMGVITKTNREDWQRKARPWLSDITECLERHELYYLDVTGQRDYGSWVSKDPESALVAYMSARITYEAFRHKDSDVKFRSLPRVNLTNEQLFFVARCLSTCSSRYDDKFPSWHRCVVPMLSMPEFAEAFGCRYGTPSGTKADCGL